jgi:hypothetical protein
MESRIVEMAGAECAAFNFVTEAVEKRKEVIHVAVPFALGGDTCSKKEDFASHARSPS